VRLLLIERPGGENFWSEKNYLYFDIANGRRAICQSKVTEPNPSKMKKSIPLMAVAMLIYSTSSGQDYNKFKLGIGAGYALPAKGTGGGGLYLEPMYRISDNFALGLKFEYMLLGQSQPGEANINATSFALGAQYYFSKNKFRPFIGGGVGTYTLGASDVLLLGSVQTVASIGFYPRVGFDLGHFNVTLDYNIISDKAPSTITIFGIPIGTPSQRDANYLGVKVGYSIGGGTK
jgi:hypothetical protein